ncbi:hypothetical protein ABDK56_07055 [Sphingomonas sp. ASV193]|uniref:hypothetical protein n=1 Tax=Sphingomonas sp. ASV193 TaxID=3144405 RepID=UPI0032E918ED
MPRPILAASGLALALAVAASASAQSRPQLFVAPSGEPFRAAAGEPYPAAKWFAAADLNHDGKIEDYEFIANVAAYFDRLDINHDGILSPDEIKGYEDHELPGILGRADGAWHGGEAYSKRSPDAAKTRDDDEMASKRADRGRGQSANDDDRPSDGNDGGEAARLARINAAAFQSDLLRGAGRFGLVPIPEPITAMDSNFDGRVTKAEMMAAARRRFKLLAGDQGYLTLATLPKTAVQR